MAEETQCSQHFYAHDESIKQNKTDIEKFYTAFSGLPTDVKHILDAVGKINDTVAKLDDKYVSKDSLALVMSTSESKMKLWVIGGTASAVTFAVTLAYYITSLVKGVTPV